MSDGVGEAGWLPALVDEDEEARADALRRLASRADLGEILRGILVESQGCAPWLRERATAAIRALPCDIVGHLAQLMRDPDREVRVAAMLMAAASRDSRVVPPALEIFLGSEEWWVRGLAAGTLGRFPSPEVRQALLSRIDDAELRPCVIAALGELCDREADGRVASCLLDADRATRTAALDALAPREGPEVFAAIQRVAQSDPDAALRERAVLILERRLPATEGNLREIAEAAARACAATSDRGVACDSELFLEKDRQ